MAKAYLVGPDIVELVFNTDVQQLTALGMTIVGKTIETITYTENVITYKIHPPVDRGDGNFTLEYDGFGNLVSLPTYTDVGFISETVVNNLSFDYIVDIEDEIVSAIGEEYLLNNENINPNNWLNVLSNDYIETLDSQFIEIDSDEDNWLQGESGAIITGIDGEPIIVAPTL